ncbi:MAG: hypothetical protein ACTHN5_13980 [Phycisphaerae bacterium]
MISTDIPTGWEAGPERSVVTDGAMTVADPHNPRTHTPRRPPAPAPLREFLPPEPHLELPHRHTHWLDLFENPPPQSPHAEHRNPLLAQKPALDVVDWLIMETLEQKGAPPAPAPPPARPGEPDLLDELVKDHLERAAAAATTSPPPTVPPEPAQAPAPPAPPAPAGPDAMLQREIDALLAPPAPSTPPAPPEPAPEATQPPTEPSAAPDLTPAELNVLVPAAPPETPVPGGEAPAPIAEAPAPAIPAHTDPDDEAAARLNEAEGVLAEELAQLMAETQAAEDENNTELPAQKIAEPTAATAPAPAESEAVPATPPSPATLDPTPVPEAPAPADPQPAPAASPEGTPPPAAPLPANMPPPVVILLPDPDPDEAAEEAPARFRLAALANDIGLMIAQIIDVPFGWIDVVNKNLLGLAAILFLLSGVALVAVSWWLGR